MLLTIKKFDDSKNNSKNVFGITITYCFVFRVDAAQGNREVGYSLSRLKFYVQIKRDNRVFEL